MSKASYLQTSFLGGEWAPEVQGRSDVAGYKTALNRCLNYYPIEQGSLLRRQGTRLIGHTKGGAAASLISFDLSGNPSQLEFTDGWIRFVQEFGFKQNGSAVIDSISSANPSVFTSVGPHGFTTNDTIWITTATNAVPSSLYSRQFVVTSTGAGTFTLKDALTAANISVVQPEASGTFVARKIAELASPYTSGAWTQCTFLQDETSLIIFHPTIAPRVITQVTTGFGFAIGLYTYADGPYLDINKTTTTLTPSGTSGSITITASSITGINNSTGFQTTDVGRHIRLYNAPAAWSVTTVYAIGDQVLYVDGNSYTALKTTNLGVVPTNMDHWALLPYLPYWSWLIITARTSTTVVTATIQQSTQSVNNSLFNALASKLWQLGSFSDTTGWPTCGTYHEGRLWTSGVAVNRFDASMSNLYGTFSPTGDDGTVSDGNAIVYTVKANQTNPTLWLATDEQGLLFGTLTSEWKIKASTLDDPITPSSIQSRRITSYGSAPSVPPLYIHRMHVFVQRMQRKLIELGHPTEGGTLYQANKTANLSLTGSHLSKTGLYRIAYTQEPKPMIWSIRNDGVLLGATYLRDEDKLEAGWQQHTLGRPCNVTYLSAGPSTNGLTDRLYLITETFPDAYHWIEALTDVYDDNKETWETFFVDAGLPTPYWVQATAAGQGFDGLRAWGYWPLIGQTVSATWGELDLGDAVVAADGHVDFPYSGEFTAAYVATLAVRSGTNLDPVIGLTYTSRGQMLRPDFGQDAGARNGPAFGKKRRNHWFAAMLYRTQGIKFGVDFGATLHAAKFQTPGGTNYAASSLYSGIISDTVQDDYSFDGMLSWQQTRPVPGHILAVGGYIESMDK